MKRILLFSLGFYFFLGLLQAQNEVNLQSHRSSEIVLHVTIDDYSFTEVETPRGIEHVISANDAHSVIEKGAPDLPRLVRSVMVPDFAHMEVKVTPLAWKDIEGVELAPSKGYFSRSDNPDLIPYVQGRWYERDEFYPGKLAALNEPYILRDFRGQAVDIYPFQYNPVSKVLRIYTQLQIQIVESGVSNVNTLARGRHQESVYQEFHNIYSRHFINYNSLSRYTPLEEQGSMLIICYDDFLEPMQDFVDWKTIIGLPTEMVPLSQVGSSAADIKAYVADYYEQNDMTYLLLVGDAQHIPPYTAGVIEGYSDNAYGYLAGNDRYQEIFVGRFSVETAAHVNTMVQRSIEYERAENFDDGWLNSAMGVARNEGAGAGHNGESDCQHMDLIRDRLLTYNYTGVYQDYDHSCTGVPNTSATQMSSRINEGVGLINYCNHGSDTGWSVANYGTSHVNALTNVGKLPFVWAVACVNGNFMGRTCFAETWTRATHNGEPTGAVAFFGSTINQPWHPPMDAQDEFNDILIGAYHDNIKRTYGGISANGMFKMLDLNNNTFGWKTAETWTIFGDPSLKVRTDDPTPILANHAPDIMLGPDFLDVSLDVSKAFATLTRDGQNVATASTTNGELALAIDDLNVGDEVVLAITAYNKIPYIMLMEVLASGPYANFVAEPTTVVKGGTVVFTDTSGNGEFSSWEWNFGTGAEPETASGQGPHDVVYEEPGRANVSLTVDGLYERVRSNYIKVLDIYTLTIHRQGAGSIRVNGVLYTGPVMIPEGTSVILEAEAEEFWTFYAWSGAMEGNSNSLQFVMDGNLSIHAGFVQAVSAVYNEGYISSDFSFPQTQDDSSCPATLTVAIPAGVNIIGLDVNYSMTSANNAWMSEQRSQLRCISEGGESETEVFAGQGDTGGTFHYNRNNLSIANDVQGGGEIEFELHVGRTWGGSGCNTSYARVDNNTWEIVVYYESAVPNYVSVSSSHDERGTVQGQGEYFAGETASVEAFPAEGYGFSHWAEEGVFLSPENPFTFTVFADRNLVAHFEPLHQVIAVSENNLQGLVYGGGEYLYGAEVSILSLPNMGYDFCCWKENGETVSTDNPYTFLVTGDRELVSHFSVQTYDIITTVINPELGEAHGGGHYDFGEMVSLYAEAIEGYHFSHWSEHGQVISYSNPMEFEATEDRELQAHFAINVYNVSVESAYPDFGIVGTLKPSYEHGEYATISAIPLTGYHFVKWTVDGEVFSLQTPFTFSVEADMEILAHFAINTYTVTAQANDWGSISPAGAIEVEHGASQTFTFTPHEGCFVQKVRVDGQNLGVRDSYTFEQVRSNHVIEVDFTQSEPLLNKITVSYEGKGNIYPSGDIWLSDGDGIQFTMTPDANHIIQSVLLNDVEVIDLLVFGTGGKAVFNLENIDKEYVLHTVYAPRNFTIEAVANVPAMGLVEGAGTYEFGKNVALNAVPAMHHHFKGWMENGFIISYHNPYHFVVNKQRSLVAQFAVNEYTLTLQAEQSAYGSVSGGGKYPYGEDVEILATPAVGHNFIHWVGDGEVLSTDNPYSISLESNQAITAVFAPSTYSIVASANEASQGSVSGDGQYTFGETAVLLAEPTTGHHFVQWEEDGQVVSSDNPFMFEVEEARELVARFSVNVYTVALQVEDESAGNVTGGGSYEHGHPVHIEAHPAEGYHFDGWFIGDDWFTDDNPAGFTAEDDIVVTARFAMTLHTVSFQVENEDDETLEDAVITLGSITQEAGEYVFEDVAPGTYSYSLAKEGYETLYAEGLEVTEDITVNVVLKQEIPLYLLQIVIKDQNEKPVNDAMMMIDGKPAVFTGETGEASIELEHGTYEYTIEKEGYQTLDGVLVMESTKEMDLLMMMYCAISFKVVCEVDGPIEMAKVIVGDDWHEATNHEGIAVFALVDGVYHYRVEKEGYQLYEGEVVVEGMDAETNVVLIVTVLENFNILGVRIFPNPANEFFIVSSEETIIQRVELYDLNGRNVYTSVPGEVRHQIAVSQWEPGVYVVRVFVDNKIIQERVIIGN